ncbi:tRNA isopentenyl-2-thiomethyl-A-37 hydroxylase MiaE [Polyangium mundeleinium]|uniref:tRNA isopentenyl-2-thiomethyl-A-37 hydroxylase MiaE n=1 Tax=Polyangium mundeleinium TaxID=2995306 RepID=A0ABT5F3S5_9BACT|nr:tRNA isopentenyl-2-thiomethyl-A-37 hydroxylase MiaE [Polyangium mundeleinium]MDC0748755.1 tRNA isopentenyl-2-thiomethyl-A-37 hydroxylase MiaE [Polyangium mundeleinium]
MLCLTRPTDPAWATLALADLATLLRDHAHCEMKAASNALSLAARWPERTEVARALVELAEEELRHFRGVLDELTRRGLTLGKPEVDVYAAELRKAIGVGRKGAPEDPLVDRLLVGAVIEARSCERFRLLCEALRSRGDEPELLAFYEELFACEARHYRTFVDLATSVKADPAAVRARLEEIARAEGRLVEVLGKEPTVHG